MQAAELGSAYCPPELCRARQSSSACLIQQAAELGELGRARIVFTNAHVNLRFFCVCTADGKVLHLYIYIYIYIYILCTADAKVLPEGQNLFSPPLPSQLSSLLASVRSAIFIVPESLADVLESGLAKKLISSCLHET